MFWRATFKLKLVRPGFGPAPELLLSRQCDSAPAVTTATRFFERQAVTGVAAPIHTRRSGIREPECLNGGSAMKAAWGGHGKETHLFIP